MFGEKKTDSVRQWILYNAKNIENPNNGGSNPKAHSGETKNTIILYGTYDILVISIYDVKSNLGDSKKQRNV